MMNNIRGAIQNLTDLFELLAASHPGEKHVNLYRSHPNRTYIFQPATLRRREHRRVERIESAAKYIMSKIPVSNEVEEKPD
jgi:hypothetical protein